MLEEIRKTVRRIPRGRVASYGAVARAAGFEGAARQVVWALRGGDKVLPWHRVLGAGGRIRLPGESGLEQQLRLESEGVVVRSGRVEMAVYEFVFPAVPRQSTASKRGLQERE